MSHHEISDPQSQEALARRHRRMQLGLGMSEEDDRRAERIAARSTIDALEKENHWSLVLIGAFVTTLMVAFGVHFSGTITVPKLPVAASTFTVVPTRTPPTARPPAALPTRTALPMSVAQSTGPTQVTGSSMPPPAPIHYDPPPSLAVAPNYSSPPAAPAPDYAARDRRVAELKRESDALDDFVRQIRNNPYSSHRAEPGGYDYQAWRYTRGNLLLQDRFDPYMKWLDLRRDEVRREKWRLEGR